MKIKPLIFFSFITSITLLIASHYPVFGDAAHACSMTDTLLGFKSLSELSAHTIKFPLSFVVLCIPNKILPASLLPAILTGLLSLCLLKVGSLYSKGRKTYLISFIIIFSSFLTYYTRILYSEMLQAILLVLIYFYLTKISNKEGQKRNYLILGLLTSILINAKITYIFIIPIISLLLIFKRTNKRNQSFYYISIMLGILVLLSYNYYRYSNIFNFGYNAGSDADLGFNTPFLIGFTGLLFSSGKSIFLYAPLLILSAFHFRTFFKKNILESIFILSCFFVSVGIFSKWWAWHGDWAWGPRFLAPFVPLILIPLYTIDYSNIFNKTFFVILSAVGIFINFLAVPIHMGYYLKPFHRVFEQQNTLALYFTPELSAIRAHFWLLISKITGSYRNPPWKNLNINDKEIINEMQNNKFDLAFFSYSTNVQLFLLLFLTLSMYYLIKNKSE